MHASVVSIHTDPIDDPFGQLRSRRPQLRGRCVSTKLIQHVGGDDTLQDMHLTNSSTSSVADSTKYEYPCLKFERVDKGEHSWDRFYPDFSLKPLFGHTVLLIEMAERSYHHDFSEKNMELINFLVLICSEKIEETYERIGFLRTSHWAHPDVSMNDGQDMVVDII